MSALDTEPLTDDDVLACLRELSALPKRHWSWPFDDRLYSYPALMQEVIRVLGAGAITGNLGALGAPKWEIAAGALVASMKQVGVRAVAVNASPWGGTWGNDPRGNDPRLAAGTPQGAVVLGRMEAELTKVRDTFDSLSVDQDWQVYVDCLWIDQECFKRQPDPEWRAALAWVNNETLAVARKVFGPATHIVQHGRGVSSYYNDDDARTGNWCCPIYTLDDVGGCLARYRDCCQAAGAAGITAVYPVLSFGGSYWVDFHKPMGWRPYAWRANDAWRWGSFLNDMGWGAAKSGIEGEVRSYCHRIMLWPRCLPKTVSTKDGPQPVTAYAAHFVAYCCGAHRKFPTWIVE